MAVDRRVLNSPSTVRNLLAIGPIKVRPDDLLGITDNGQVRVVRHHDDLPPLLSFGQHRYQETHDSFVVEVFFGLIKDDGVSALVGKRPANSPSELQL